MMSATVEKGFNDLEKVVLRHESGSAVEVYLYGACITRWTLAGGQDLLFLSEKSYFDMKKKPIRGGIPLVFPQFGPGVLPQHGFARNNIWTYVGLDHKDSILTATFTLQDNEKTRTVWDNHFELTLKVSLGSWELSMNLSVANKNEEREFSFTSLLHTYFLVDDIAATRVLGLKNHRYIDKLNDPTVLRTEDREEILFAQETDRVYQGLTGSQALQIHHAGEFDIEITNQNFRDSVVWNPWIEKAKAMEDFGDEEYKKMVCVELGTVAEPITLNSGETWVAGQTLKPLKKNGK